MTRFVFFDIDQESRPVCPSAGNNHKEPTKGACLIASLSKSGLWHAEKKRLKASFWRAWGQRQGAPLTVA